MAVELTLLQISIERRPQVLNWIYGLVGCPRIELGSSGLRDRRITAYATFPGPNPRYRSGIISSQQPVALLIELDWGKHGASFAGS